MEMRLATAEEFEVFNNMYQDFFLEENGQRIPKMPKEKFLELLETESLYFAILNEEIVGYATIFAFEEIGAKIDSIYIKEKGKGYGTKFYKLIEEEIKASDISRIFVYVFAEKPENFWFRNGFRYVAETEEFEKILNP